MLLAGRENPYQEQIEGYSAKGCRVLLLGMYDGALTDETLSAGFLPIALILLSNKIRAEVPETFGYFASQGVAVKVISGDNARTVSGWPSAPASKTPTASSTRARSRPRKPSATRRGKYTVFGRVTPRRSAASCRRSRPTATPWP
ncbi:MAG: hypothetical protein ACLSHG_00300 [Oscillospiraceae bacterium]